MTSTVTILSQVPPPTHGSTIMTSQLIEALTSLGFEPVLIDRRFSRSIDEVGRFSVRKVASALWLVCRAIANLARHRRAPLVLFATTRPMSLAVDAAIALVARTFRIEVIAYVHTVGFADMRGPSSGLARMVLGRARVVVVLADALRADVAPYATAITVLPNAVPDARVTQRRVADLAFVSNFVPGKGIDDFIQLAGDLESVTGTVVGAESYAGQTEEIRARVPRGVRVVGTLSNAEARDVVGSHRLLVFPSTYKYEAQPLAIIEALAAGTPCVAYDVGGVHELVAECGAGIVVPSGDYAALQEAVRLLLRDDAVWQKYSDGARAAYIKFHSPTAYARAWNDLLHG
jgi:glycosyltransferase involved in cell wall biosynthesis